jgi:hypothetical protein
MLPWLIATYHKRLWQKIYANSLEKTNLYLTKSNSKMMKKTGRRLSINLNYILSYRHITRLGFYCIVFFLARVLFKSIYLLPKIDKDFFWEQSTLTLNIILIPIFILFLMYKSDY